MALQINPADAILEEMARELGLDPDDLKGDRFFQLVKGVFPVYIMNLTRKMAPYGGALKDNYASVTLANDTAKNELKTVPPGKRWYLFGGRITNGDDVNRQVYIQLFNADDKNIGQLAKSQTVNAGAVLCYPNTEAVVTQMGSGAYPVPMKAGDYIKINWAAGGASAGGDSDTSALVVELNE